MVRYMAAQYARKTEKPDEASTFLKAGMQANPTSLLLHYAYVELAETKGNTQECHQVYNGLIEQFQKEIDSLNASIATEIQQALDEKAKVEEEEKATLRSQGQVKSEEDEKDEGVRARERESITKAITDSKASALGELKRLAANVWIMQMRFARRAEGIQAARAVFGKARKWPNSTWQVFEASGECKSQSLRPCR